MLKPFPRSILAFALLTPFLALPALAGSPAGKTYGAVPAAAETTSIARLLSNPQAFAGKTVKVEGKVLDVCPKAGCWMELGVAGGAVRVKVDDGVLVFPVDAKGKPAVAEGKVEILEMSREQYVRWAEHLAEERGEAFDPATVGEGPYRLVQIHATGAVIDGGEPAAP